MEERSEGVRTAGRFRGGIVGEDGCVEGDLGMLGGELRGRVEGLCPLSPGFRGWFSLYEAKT